MHKQLGKSGVDFEIRVYDDASNRHIDNQKLIKELPHVVYKINEKNFGRLATRYRLAEDAKYDRLLFMDADVFPSGRFFVSKLIKTLENNRADVYFGGITVPVNLPSPDKSLRWKYGKYRENKPLQERLKMPYKSLLSGAFVIKKGVFLNDTKDLLPLKRYGLDSFFSYKLKENNRKIHHYNNPATHLGLETNNDFIYKTQDALKTFKFLINNNLLPKDYIKVTTHAFKIRKFLSGFLCRLIYKRTESFLRWHLLRPNPSLNLFDLYKLLYFCQLK